MSDSSDEVKYLRRALDLLPDVPKFSDAASKVIDSLEAKYNFRFPEAVREWYSLEGAVELLEKYSNADQPTPPSELGAPIDNWYGGGRVDLLRQGLLHIMAENQGVCNWAVRIGSSDDPEVVIEVDSAPNAEWQKHSPHFSEFLYTRIWDFSLPRLSVLSQDPPLDKATLDRLQANFGELYRSTVWPGTTTYRFELPEGRILIWNNEFDDNGNGQADWTISASTEDDLELLLRQIWSCGDLRNSLYTDDTNALQVLEKLRRK